MPTPLCGECYLQGYCRRLQSRLVTDDELTPSFLRAVRTHLCGLTVTPGRMAAYLDAAYRDYPGRIVDARGDEVDLDTDFFDLPNLRYWFRDLCRELPDHVRPRLRREARARFKVVASILRAYDPLPARLWGKEVANDHDAMAPVLVRRGACPYLHFP